MTLCRLPEAIRADIEAVWSVPVPLPGYSAKVGGPATIALKQVASFTRGEDPKQISRENSKRRVVSPPMRAAAILSPWPAEAQQLTAAKVQLPPGYWIGWGGEFENLAVARPRLMM